MTNPDFLLNTIAALSREFGGPDYVRAGGGNTSVKTATTIWVKPSGTTLSGLTAGSFVAMDRAKLGELYRVEMPAQTAAREEKVKSLMAAAVLPGQAGRPSVEAALHDLLPATFVVHNHPPLVNGLTCGRRGASECVRLFPDALWIPYVDPGFSLAVDVRRRVEDYARARGRQPAVLILENHGIFVTGETAEAIRADYRHVFDTLQTECRKAGVATELRYRKPAAPAEVEAVCAELRDLLGDDAKFAEYSAGFEVVRGPLTPDHLVFAKSFPFEGPLTREALEQFRARNGYHPRVVAVEAGVFGIGNSKKKAEVALDLAQDGALVQQVAAAFGGLQFMSDAAREFIESWEVEAYRQKQME